MSWLAAAAAACNGLIGAEEYFAAPPVAGCDPTKAFGPIETVNELSTDGDEGHARLSGNQLTAYVDSVGADASSASDLHTASRGQVDAAFGPLRLVPGLQTNFYESSPFITGDNLSLYFISDRTVEPASLGSFDIFVATRGSPEVDFGTIQRVTNVNSPAFEAEPYLSADGNALYFRRGATVADGDLFVSTRAANGAFGEGKPLSKINAVGSIEAVPVVTGDQRTLYFYSDRPGSKSAAPDIWVARRNAISDEFEEPRNITELNSTDAEYPTWVTPDGCTLYFVSDRPGGKGKRDIYRATRGK